MKTKIGLALILAGSLGALAFNSKSLELNEYILQVKSSSPEIFQSRQFEDYQRGDDKKYVYDLLTLGGFAVLASGTFSLFDNYVGRKRSQKAIN